MSLNHNQYSRCVSAVERLEKEEFRLRSIAEEVGIVEPGLGSTFAMEAMNVHRARISLERCMHNYIEART